MKRGESCTPILGAGGKKERQKRLLPICLKAFSCSLRLGRGEMRRPRGADARDGEGKEKGGDSSAFSLENDVFADKFLRQERKARRMTNLLSAVSKKRGHRLRA